MKSRIRIVYRSKYDNILKMEMLSPATATYDGILIASFLSQYLCCTLSTLCAFVSTLETGISALGLNSRPFWDS